MARRTSRKRFTPSRAPARVTFVLAPPVVPLDLFGPLAVFQGANRFARRPHYQIEVVTAHALQVPTVDGGPRIVADRIAQRVPAALDTLVVISGTEAPQFQCPATLRFVQRASTRARRVVSVCSGAFVLARAGLLAGRTATTHWAYADELARTYPDITVEPDRLWVKDGCVYTSAGVTTGIDLALALVAEDLGGDAALMIARMLVVFVQRPGGQTQFSTALAAQESERAPIRELCAWLAGHLQGDLSVDALAARVGMSPRNFVRVFSREVGAPPAAFVLRLRVEAAQRRLERSDDALAEVASHAGFGGPEVMNRAFRRVLGTTPAAYRERFRSPGRARARLTSRHGALQKL